MNSAELKLHALVSNSRLIVSKPKKTIVPIGLIKIWAAKACGVTVEAIESKSRKREKVLARMVAMTYIRKNTSLSLSSIGELFGNKNHASVLHSIRKFDDLLDINDIVLLDVVEKFNKQIVNASEKYKLL